ncbi:MAG: RluA family pseudouridine synthase [Thermomicrobiales bacterium]|jgi:23S rRNA pseudouridine1911/1915/1917 synthase|nr:RluA family pseudouridine synthase [Thermomicrobiales bacterium]
MTDELLPLTDELDDSSGLQILLPQKEDTGARLDRYLAAQFPDLSRTVLQRTIAAGLVTVDGVPRKQVFKVTAGQEIQIELPEPVQTALVAEPIDLTILYEDEDLLALDKPSGLVVHPGPGNPSGTLVNGLLHYLPNLEVGGSNRPGIVHRLDKETSGVMVVGISDRGHRSLTRQWANRTVDKRYLALVQGEVDVEQGTIDVPIGRHPTDRLRMAPISSGKTAVSHFTVLERFTGSTLVEVELVTGRTHQIRVHMAFIGHPVVGDSVYNRTAGPFGGTRAIVSRQFLHASRLSIDLPSTDERATFESPLPPDLETALADVRRSPQGVAS